MEVVVVEACEEFVEGVATRDVQLGDCVWVRIFLPQSDRDTALPLVLYAHGGSYSSGQPHWLLYHTFCSTMCKLSRSIWLSLSYRLAPPHRLPAAFDDASLALSWLISQAQQQPSHTSHPWLRSNCADFSNFFLAGESAGANIMLKLAMDATLLDVKPLCIRGLLLIHPGLHSEENRKFMDNEDLYDMALPEGETLDYAPVNPMHASAPPLLPLSAYANIFLSAAEADFRYGVTLRFYDIVRRICPHVQLITTPEEAGMRCCVCRSSQC